MTAGKASALHRLPDLLRNAPAADAFIEFGGHVEAATPTHYRIVGLGRAAGIGDRLIAQNDPDMMAEVISVERDFLLAKPYRGDRHAPIGARMFCAGPPSLRPSSHWRGRILNAIGEPIDGRGPLPIGARKLAVDRPPPAALARAPVGDRIRTGVRVIDAFTPLCLGQRIGVFAGSGVGKSTLLGMLAHGGGFDDIVIGLIGERSREVRDFLDNALKGGRDDSIVVVATGDESPVMRRQAGRAAMTIAEWLRDCGRRVLLVIDSITRYAQATREIGIAGGEPAVARGYPPSVFSELPRLLERAGPGATPEGSITAVVSVLVDGDDHNDPVADSIRGILDGHIVMDRAIADRGRFPAIDVLKSLSRLADRAWSLEEAALIRQVRALIARYEDSADIRAMGGYQPGLDPALDQAVALAPRLYGVLSQFPADAPSEDACREIAAALRPADQS